LSVSRELLYAEVWAEPMTKVASRYQVSSSYLARVCTALEIPRPKRGYWAKLEHGHKVRCPPLPDGRVGIPIAWTPGMAVPEHRMTERTNTSALRPRSSWTRRPARHPLVVGAQESFTRSYDSHLGYLRPYKRKLPDVYVSKNLLMRALDAASELYLKLEDRRHAVGFAPHDYLLHRPDLDHRLVSSEHFWNRDRWAPSTFTVVVVNEVMFGLTVYEPSELVEVKSQGGTYVRVAIQTQRRRSGDWVHKEEMPSGRLSVRAYSAHTHAEWQQTWHADTPEQLPELAKKILGVLKRAVPELAATIQKRTAIERQAAEKRQREWEEYKQREDEKARIAAEKAEQERQLAALEASRRDLVALVDAWAFARRAEEFFADVGRRAAALDDDTREAIGRRVVHARDLLGTVDTLKRLREWKAPDER
jgi:hypothetical protein